MDVAVFLVSSDVLIPVIVTTAYLATRKGALEGADKEHKKHRRDHYVAVDKGALTVQALPYLAILAVFALLTLPAPWRGLQPIDGWLLLIAYLAYLLQALVRGREKGEEVEWSLK